MKARGEGKRKQTKGVEEVSGRSSRLFPAQRCARLIQGDGWTQRTGKEASKSNSIPVFLRKWPKNNENHTLDKAPPTKKKTPPASMAVSFSLSYGHPPTCTFPSGQRAGDNEAVIKALGALVTQCDGGAVIEPLPGNRLQPLIIRPNGQREAAT